ncbi:SpaA isopeptide-forming pilin-related protein [Microbacterium sp.]|uniref:SpaA isopeptide-forming pilin-related protein n=1 Tax=Microbacterium sp. TaxID=51671 RepID=UPI0039E71112
MSGRASSGGVLRRAVHRALVGALCGALLFAGLPATMSFADDGVAPEATTTTDESGVAAADALVASAATDVSAAPTAPAGADAAASPTIASDLEDYPPGGTVTLTGTGWQPGETVTIVVNDTDGATWSLTQDVVAAADGTLALVFTLPNYYVPNYDVTATGALSGTATTTFTDAATGAWQYWMTESAPSSGSSVAASGTVTYTLNARCGGTNTASCSVTGAVVTLTLTGGATFNSLSLPTGVVLSNGNKTATWTLGTLNRTGLSVSVTATVDASATVGSTVAATIGDNNDSNGSLRTGTGYYESRSVVVAATALSCTQGTFYTVSNDGRLYEVTSPGVTPNATTTLIGTSSPVWSYTGVNGLAIAPGGTMAYAFYRHATNQVDILGYNPTTGVGSTLVSNYSIVPATTDNMVAGAVNPVNGYYYFGGYTSAVNRFYVWVFNPANNSITLRGYIVPNGATTSGNSDILFDNQGNLYLSYSNSGTSAVHELVTVTAANLAAGTSGSTNQLETNSTALTLTTPTTTYNGIAFDSSGRLFAQDATSGSSTTYVRTIDPGTGATLGGPTTLTLSGATTGNPGTDLASCLYPGTVSVRKNLPDGRVAAGNQFALSITRGTTTQATATTTGTATGIQSQIAGPAIGVANATYTIAEAASGTTVLGNYVSTYVCVDGASNVVATGTGTTLSYTFPTPSGQASAGPDIVCTFTNTPIAPATVTISKTVQDVNGLNPQAGVGWTVGAALGTGSTTGTTITTPATATTGATGAVATPWSITFPSSSATANVVISETQQTGYAFVSGVCTITPLSGSATTVNLASASGTLTGVTPGATVSCVFTNKQQPGSAVWQKTDATTGSALAGSTWTLTGPEVPANTVVSDCTASPCTTGLYLDADPAAGAFQLTGLAWGSYTLQEQSAPTGYELSTTQHTFTISATSLTPTVSGSPFANTRILGAVTWQKVDAVTPATSLAGSEWKIVGPAPATTELAVVDCVAASAAGCTGVDKDNRAGYFSVTGLAWGSYSLVETKAPAGYVLDPTPRTFAIAAVALTASVGQIVNVQQDVPLLPLTGGLGRDWFLFGGSGALIAALGILFWRRRQSRISP